MLSNNSVGTQLKTATRTGDQARGVSYLDRRLGIAKNIVNKDAELNADVAAIVKTTYPTYENTVEILQAVAMIDKVRNQHSATFQEMDSNLILSFRNWLVALHVHFAA